MRWRWLCVHKGIAHIQCMTTKGYTKSYLWLRGDASNHMVKNQYIKRRKRSVCTSVTFAAFSVTTISRGSVFTNWFVSITVIEAQHNSSKKTHFYPAAHSCLSTTSKCIRRSLSFENSIHKLVHIFCLLHVCFCYHLLIVHQSSLWVCTLPPEAQHPWAWP